MNKKILPLILITIVLGIARWKLDDILTWYFSEPEVATQSEVVTQKEITQQPNPSNQTTSRFSGIILGMWTIEGADNATFSIDKKNIFYVEPSKAYPYTLTDNQLKIQYDGYIEDFTVKMPDKDTLILSGNGVDNIFLRFK